MSEDPDQPPFRLKEFEGELLWRSLDHGFPQTPEVRAACKYIAGILSGRRIPQKVIAEEFGCTQRGVREWYKKIAATEDIIII